MNPLPVAAPPAPRPPARPASVRAAVLACFFLSGAAALVYEVLWVRLLTLLFGHTAAAVSAVLSAFMAGLALGAWAAGRAADRLSPRRALLLYAVLEAGIALCGLASGPVLGLAKTLLLRAGFVSASLSFQSLIAFGASFLLLLPAAALMGATLPVLLKWWAASAEDSRDGGGSLGLLYGANTLGAVAGTAAAGFFLVPAWGLRGSFYFAAGLNVLSAAATALLGRGARRDPAPVSLPGASLPLPGARSLCALLFLTGAAAMACQVAWSRAFALVLGSSTYSFTVMLLTFLLGLSAGSLAFSAVRRVWTPSLSGLAVCLGLLSLSVLAYLPFFNWLPYAFVRLFPLAASGPAAARGVQWILCAVVMAVPTFLMGTVLPWALAVLAPDPRRLGAAAGSLYTANTLGNIAGSAVAGLALVPYLGAEKSLVLAAWCFAAAGVVAALKEVPGGKARRILPAALLGAVGLADALRPAWNPLLLSSGAFLYAPQYLRRKNFAGYLEDLGTNRLLFHKDGVSSTVTVLETPWGDRFLRVNGKTDASAGADMLTQVLCGHLPALFHPRGARSALVIGFGSGVTAGVLASDPGVRSVDCVEIEPAVLEAAPYFSSVNREPWKAPKFRAAFADGRHFLETSRRTYDLITSEPSNPWIAGVAGLFTREAFSLERDRLSDDGVFCQWFQGYAMSVDDFKLVMRTFADVFPHVLLLTAGNQDYFLLGSRAPWRVDYRRLEKLFAEDPRLRRDLGPLDLGHPFTLLSTAFLLEDADFRAFAGDGPAHVDDRPSLEFTAPLHLHKGEHEAIFSGLQEARRDLLPPWVEGIDASLPEWVQLYNLAGEAFLRAGRVPQAVRSFDAAMRRNPSDPRTWTNVGRVQNLMDQHLAAEESYRKAMENGPQYALPRFHLGMLYLDQGLKEKGLKLLEEGLDRAPGDPMGSLVAGRLYMEMRRPQEARRVLRAALERPGAPPDLRRQLEEAFREASPAPVN